MCGGARSSTARQADATGPSPRVRGSPRPDNHRAPLRGSIPACAGEPSSRLPSVAIRWVHPRVCGGAIIYSTPRKAVQGPSPRVRGSPGVARNALCLVGSIPACAGEPRPPPRLPRPKRVHPRVCGGASAPSVETQSSQGPSPRVRGSRRARTARRQRSRSIPACAGEPAIRSPPPGSPPVHPRVCGGANPAFPDSLQCCGPSPRVRGSRLVQARAA